MHRSRVKGALTRRHLMGLAAGFLPLKGWAGDDEDDKRPSASSTSAARCAVTRASGSMKAALAPARAR